MIHITKMGENTTHDASFQINRENGYPTYLLLLIPTPAQLLVDRKWIHTKRDCAVLFKPGQPHHYKADGPQYINDWAHIEISSPFPSAHFPFGIPISLHNANTYYDLFHLIYTEHLGVSTQRSLTLHHLTLALIHMLIQECNTQEFPPLYYELAALREQIYKQPGRNWNISQMADYLHISNGYLHSVYQHFFGITCIHDLIQSRMQAACEYLTSTDKSIADIAFCCGYKNPEHFTRQFKEHIGVSPTHYRRME